MEVSPLIAYTLAWLAVGSGIWALFDRAESTITPEFRASVSSRLRNIDASEALRSWPEAFGHMFDAVFGGRHLSWRCFRRSVVASIAAVTVMLVISWARNPQELAEFFRGDFLMSTGEIYVLFALMAVFINVPTSPRLQ